MHSVFLVKSGVTYFNRYGYRIIRIPFPYFHPYLLVTIKVIVTLEFELYIVHSNRSSLIEGNLVSDERYEPKKKKEIK
jgi:hypothetical protein